MTVAGAHMTLSMQRSGHHCRVKLCDFGCARKWETKEVPAQRVGRFKTFAGTPAYMSPQVEGRDCTACRTFWMLCFVANSTQWKVLCRHTGLHEPAAD